MLRLCKWYEQLPEFAAQFSRAYSQISTSLGYTSASISSVQAGRSPRTLADDHIDYLLYEWISAHLPLEQLPLKMLFPVLVHDANDEDSAFASFVSKFLENIVTVLYVADDATYQKIESIATLVGMTVQELGSYCFSSIYAASVAFKALDNDEDEFHTFQNTKIMLSRLQKAVPDYRTVFKDTEDLTKLKLLDWYLLGPTSSFSAMTRDILKASIKYLADKFKQNPADFLATPNTDCAIKIILHLRLQLACEHRRWKKLRLFETLEVVFSIMSSPVNGEIPLNVPAVFRTMLDTLIVLLPTSNEDFPGAPHSCCSLIGILADISLNIYQDCEAPQNPDEGRQLNEHLQDVISALVKYEQQPSAVKKEKSKHVYGVLQSIFEAYPETFLKNLKSLDPFPSIKLYEKLNAFIGERSLIDEMERFVTSVQSSTLEMPIISLAYLARIMT